MFWRRSADGPAPDISIIGHSDTVGSDEDNFALGLKRARFVAELFDSAKIARDRVVVDSHGEKKPPHSDPRQYA